MRESGQVTVIFAIIFLFIVLFIFYLAYSIFNQPVTEVIEAVQGADADNIVPSSILPNLDIAWAVGPIIAIICSLLAAVAYIYRREHEHSAYG